jgi:hypothetical protein
VTTCGAPGTPVRAFAPVDRYVHFAPPHKIATRGTPNETKSEFPSEEARLDSGLLKLLCLMHENYLAKQETSD